MGTFVVTPPMRSGLFCQMDEAVLDMAGWSFFDDLAGDLSAPDALPMGGVVADGMFGPHTSFVPREKVDHFGLLNRLRLTGHLGTILYGPTGRTEMSQGN